MTKDEAAILEVIETETTAFLCRDFEAWAGCLIHDEGLRRFVSDMGGMMSYHEGWSVESDSVKRIMEKFPTPNPDAAKGYRRTNHSMRIRGGMAWVSFDQYGVRSDDPLVTVGLSHQIRILENTGTGWKIAMLGCGDTGLDYLDFPAIRIDENARVLWMNEVGRQELRDHPALMKSGAFLRGRYRRDDDTLRAVIAEVAALTPMDRRPSLPEPRGRPADPVVLMGADADGQHIIWVSVNDGMLLVTFRDGRNERARLDQAAELFDLSPAQTRLATLVVEGLDLARIAETLSISHSTAKTHLSRIFDKTGVRSQAALVSRLLGIDPPK